MDSKKKAVLDRIKQLEEAIAKGREYLETGRHAQWSGFRPLFYPKVRDGKRLPPHKEWMKNVFLPRRERALRKARKALARLTEATAVAEPIRRVVPLGSEKERIES